MTKKERRKRAKQRARERQASEIGKEAQEQAQAVVAEEPSRFAGEPPFDLAPERAATLATGRVEVTIENVGLALAAVAAEKRAPESEFITGPVAPRVRPVAAKAAGAQAATVLIDEPLVRRELDQLGTGDGEDEGDDDDDDDQEDEEDDDAEEGDEGDGEDEGDDDDDDEEDAIVELASAALEHGVLSWQDVVTHLCIAQVDDPRLALLCSLVIELPGEVQGAALLTALGRLGMEELVAEAKEAVAEGGGVELDAAELALVRKSSGQLSQKAAERVSQVVDNQGYGSPTRRKPERALKASDLRSRSSLGVVVPASNAGRPVR